MAEIRLILAPSRSGSTALVHCLNGHSDLTFVRSPIKDDYIQKGKPFDPVWYKTLAKVPTKIGFSKLSFGMHTSETSTYIPFPLDDKKFIKKVKPIFMFRDPVQTKNSWARKDRSISLFHKAYKHVLQLLETIQKNTDKVMVITYEKFTNNPQKVLKEICDFWGIPFQKSMLEWKHKLPEHIKGNLHETIIKSSKVKKNMNKIILSKKEVSKAEKEFRKSYEKISKIKYFKAKL